MISKINRRNTKLIERVLYRLCACENCIKYIIAGRINKNTNIIWDYDMLDMEKLYKKLDEFCVK